MRAPRRRIIVALVTGVALGAVMHADAASLPISSEKLTTFSACSLVVSPNNTTGEEEDAWVDQGHPTTVNTQNQDKITSNLNANQRAYYSFTLSSCLVAIPSTATVLSATLQLYIHNLANTCRTIDVFRLTGSWSETTITWNTQPAPVTTSSNSPASSSKTSSAVIGNIPTCAFHTVNSYASWDVTADVAAFVTGTATNNGWMLRDDAEDGVNQATQLDSRRGSNVSQAPKLLITYTRT